MKNPCENCPDVFKDQYGYFCDLSCGRYGQWLAHQEGVKEAVAWIRNNQRELEPTTTYMHIDPVDWQSQLKEWGIK